MLLGVLVTVITDISGRDTVYNKGREAALTATCHHKLVQAYLGLIVKQVQQTELDNKQYQVSQQVSPCECFTNAQLRSIHC